MSKRPALGKGMSALIGAAESADESDKNAVINVALDKIEGNPDQPRKSFDQHSLKELSESIKEKGIIQPIIVEEKNGAYMIIAGERRFRASKLAGLKEVPVIVKNFSENEKLEIALIENIQREDLNPIEEAFAYHDLMDRGNLNQEEVAAKVGKNRSTVANSLRLLKLPENIQNTLAKGAISSGHARAILALDTEEQMEDLHKRIITYGLSVREAEAFSANRDGGKADGSKKSAKAGGTDLPRDPELKSIEEKFIDIFGTKVNINGTMEKGRIEISYFSMEDLDRLYEIVKPD
ncbi:MAG: ParB/RepB/Spo0J family partition protein [Spirochaetales bacterium]|uniref:ParB/RepB/Spo0J family partition protein n=1 Tax=Candidatus Thalassospirochaeta sargassi TaxID=3119039 RepID=A0AAJ1IBC0_9SPIO|nr:ParB/RepB/Spo0J family partition protein [Spirochaetales bacterium]